MGDDKQIVEKKEVRLFLDDFLDDLQGEPPEFYDLEKEYAKSRKHRSWPIYISIGIAVVAVVLGALGVSKLLSEENKKVSVEIDAFDDLNLKGILDMYTKLESSLTAAIAEKAQLEVAYKAEIDVLKGKLSNDVYVINQLLISSGDKKERIQSLENTFGVQSNEIAALYAPQIAQLESTIAELQEQILSFDTRRLEEAQQQESILSSERQVFELEKRQMAESYEQTIATLQQQIAILQNQGQEDQRRNMDQLSKNYKNEMSLLDPLINDSYGNTIIQSLDGSVTLREPFEPLITNVSSPEALDLIEVIKKAYADLNYAADILRSFPQKNSLSVYVEAVRSLALQNAERSARLFSDTVAKMQKQLQEAYDAYSELNAKSISLNTDIEFLHQDITSLRSENTQLTKEVNEFDYFFRTLLEKSGDSGYVIDARNTDSVVVYIDPLYAVGFNGQKAYVFRKSDEYIGTLLLEKNAEGIYGKIESVESGKKIESFDRILFDLSGENTTDKVNN